MAKLVTLILTYDRRGTGRDDDPVRMVEQLFTPEGKLVAERDALHGCITEGVDAGEAWEELGKAAIGWRL